MTKSFAKVSQVKAGTMVVPDAGFTCLKSGVPVQVHEDDDGLYLSCSHGKHYLDGQLRGDPDDEYVGLYLQEG